MLKYAGATAGISLTGIAGCLGSDEGEYPSEPIELIVPYSAGGGSDTYARKFTEVIQDGILDTEFQVSNIEGAGAMNGQREMTTSDPDGYTISATVQAGNAISYLSQDLDFGFPETKAIASYVSDAQIMTADPDLGVRNDYEELARMYREGELETIGIIPNSLQHAAALQLDTQDEWDIEFDRFVDYDGVAESYEATAAGEVPTNLGATSPTISNIEDGELDPVVLFEDSPVESEAIADTPTLQDLGYDDFGALGGIWRGWLAPAETPDEHVEALENAIEEAMDTSEIQEWSDETGNPVEFRASDEVQELHEDAFDVYDDLELEEHFSE